MKADIFQASRWEQQGRQSLFRTALVQSLVDEADGENLCGRHLHELQPSHSRLREGAGSSEGHSRSVSSWTCALTWLTAACRSFQLRKALSAARSWRAFTRASK